MNANARPLPSEQDGLDGVRLIAHPSSAVHPTRRDEYYARMFCTPEQQPDVESACAFCYSAAMNNEGYTLMETPALAALFRCPPPPFV